MRSLLVFCLVLLTGCQNGFSAFYRPYFNPQSPPTGLVISDLKYLDLTETPQIYSTNDMSRDVKIARSKHWVPIGQSSFNGAAGSQAQLLSQAKSIGASMVLVTSRFTENRTITTPLFLPNNQTTYYNGTTNGQIYGNNSNSATYNSNTSGTATTYGTTVVPLTSVQSRFDQTAIYFVLDTKKLKFGISIVALTPELRTKYERNTGALIDIVFEDSPAFNANILPDDILTEVDGKAVLNAPQAMELIKNTQPANGISIVKVLRNGTEKTINLQLDL
jgi:serine protease Do